MEEINRDMKTNIEVKYRASAASARGITRTIEALTAISVSLLDLDDRDIATF